MTDGQPGAAVDGVPQGGSISPLLANAFLHYVLDLWWMKKIRPRLRGKATLVRYCDDFVILFQYKDEAESVLALLKARLHQFGLQIAEEKTHLTYLKPRERGSVRSRRHMTFLGFSVRLQLKRAGQGLRIVFSTESKRFTRARIALKERLLSVRHRPLEYQQRLLNQLLAGHFNYYGFAGNSYRIAQFRYEAERAWRRSLSTRGGGNKRKGWLWMRRILSQYPLASASLRVTYPQLEQLAVLQ